MKFFLVLLIAVSVFADPPPKPSPDERIVGLMKIAIAMDVYAKGMNLNLQTVHNILDQTTCDDLSQVDHKIKIMTDILRKKSIELHRVGQCKK